IHVSNVMFWDNKAKAPTRIGYTVENGAKKRVSKKSGQILD
ncbi:MAG: 50S ribosomal protein L24, partial [Clostridiales bacterium]|nr:50S ribosomal protein L24 [Clostridiales bacterium]